jgi:hypothetical protein
MRKGGRSMSVRKYSWEYIFIESKVFVQNHGPISKPDRERLYFDLAQGNGDPIPRTGGLKRIRCGLGGHRGTSENAWEVVFAEYVYSDIRKRVFMLVDRCPLALRGDLSEEEEEKWRQHKEKLDELMGHYYEGLQEERDETKADPDKEEDEQDEDDKEESSV